MNVTFDEWWSKYPTPGGEDYVAAQAAWNAAMAEEQKYSMMAGSQLSALRLQLKDAQADAAAARKAANSWKDELMRMKERHDAAPSVPEEKK